jgi:hypothetical protein
MKSKFAFGICVLMLLIVGIGSVWIADFVSGQGSNSYSGGTGLRSNVGTGSYGGNTGFGGYSGGSSYVNRQYSQPSYGSVYSRSDIKTYWPILDDNPSTCEGRQDMILQIAPGGCQPAVVRSDLLAEQNVPVFCQVDAYKLNPLINIKEIRNIRFSSEGNEYVTGVGFHPARAALRSHNRLLGSPLINNVGYVVVILKRNPVEEELPEEIVLNLSAQIEYYSGNALGVGRTEFILQPVSDSEWDTERNKQSFWQGRYFVRLEESNPEFATVSIYYGDRKIRTLKVENGKTSSQFFVPGSYCQAGLQVAFDGFVAPQAKATLEINDDVGTEVIDVYRGSRFLNGKCGVDDLFTKGDNEGSIFINCGGSERIRLDLGKREKVEGEKVELRDKNKGEKIDEYFDKAIRNYETVVDDFPAVPASEFSGLDDPKNKFKKAGEEALWNAIILARIFGNSKTEERLINRHIEEYPNNDKGLESRLNELFEIDSSLAGISVNLDNGVRNIRLVRLKHYDEQGISARFDVGGKEQSVSLGRERGFSNIDTIIRLDRVDRDRAEITVFCRKDLRSDYLDERDRRGGYVSSDDYFSRERDGTRLVLDVGESKEAVCGDESIKLEKISGELFAKIRLLPNARGTKTETPLTVGIGIEKRAIKLSPEKTAEIIDNLDETIEKWEGINSKLGNVVSGMKGACFATAAALTAKNFLFGAGGEALAREKVMPGWTDRCEQAVADGRPMDSNHGSYANLNDCFRKNAGAIRTDVDKMEELIDSYNEKIKANEVVTSEAFLGDKFIDTEKAAEFIVGDLKSKLGASNLNVEFNGEKFNLNEFGNDLSFDSWKVGQISIGQMKDLRVFSDILQSDVSDSLKESANKKIGEIVSGVQDRINVAKESDKIADALESLVGDRPEIDVFEGVGTIQGVYRGQTYGEKQIPGVSGVGEGEPIQYVRYKSGTYLVVLNKDPRGGKFSPRKIYELRGEGENVIAVDESTAREEAQKLGDAALADVIDEFNTIERFSFERYDVGSYNNRYLNAEVRYYETDKGVPAVVPFDRQSGWYAGTQQILPVFGQRQAFDSSGAASSFWLCNVGKNGREEFSRSGFGDDACRQFNFYTGEPLNKFPGLSDDETRRLVRRAVNALNEAGRQHGSGLQSVRIEGEGYSVGSPAVSVPKTKCQDFMDPTECQVLFNVCDPVICPNSRCNLGGQFHVADVIQSGIVGSALLCLPNFKEGVYIPVCLTGIHAGIDAYLSILKAHQQCLQHSLDTGQQVGICDQVTSVYLCEFFWRQIAPAAKVIIPRLAELALGQGTRGGGEYLTVMAAWQNTQQSIDFFTQEYAVNALDAYRVRSVGEVGSQFCKSFVSAKGPTSFENLIEPDSPVQFNAWFDSTRFSDVTVPATAQYKVFYHIFAGNDQGVQYVVYLKSPPESSIHLSPQLVVANGFAPRGESATESKDFTGPEGYKELCVNINGQEKCGFGKVSTSFALNAISDGFVADEIARGDISSERDCVSGGGGGIRTAALLNPNIQAGVEEALLPEVYNRGIVRICATDNPGSSTEPARFIDVGHCGNQRIKCWLDKKSIDNAISDENNGTRTELKKVFDNEEERLRQEQMGKLGEVSGDINKLRDDLDKVDVSKEQEILKFVGRVDTLLRDVIINSYKAELLMIKAQVYDSAARALLGVRDVQEERDAQAVQGKGDGDDNGEDKKKAVYTLGGVEQIGALDVEFVLVDGMSSDVFFFPAGNNRATIGVYLLDTIETVGFVSPSNNLIELSRGKIAALNLDFAYTGILDDLEKKNVDALLGSGILVSDKVFNYYDGERFG